MRNNYNLINISNIKYHEFFYPLLIQKILNGTKKKFIIVLPNLDNSVKNFDSVSSFTNGCQAICMKHQSNPNTDSNLKFYNDKFAPNSYSWIVKETHLINVAPPSLDT